MSLRIDCDVKGSDGNERCHIKQVNWEGLHIAFRKKWWLENVLPYAQYGTTYIVVQCFMLYCAICIITYTL